MSNTRLEESKGKIECEVRAKARSSQAQRSIMFMESKDTNEGRSSPLVAGITHHGFSFVNPKTPVSAQNDEDISFTSPYKLS